MRSVSKPIRLYSDIQRGAILAHLLNLSVQDRYMRFFSTLSNDAIGAYVDRLDLTGKDVVFGVYDAQRILVGMLHVAPTPATDSAEFALSVDADARKLGIGDALFERGLLHCESMNIKHIYMNCLSTNQAIKRMAQKRNMTITSDYGESIAELDINDTNQVAAWLKSVQTDAIALYDLRCLPMRQAWEDYLQEVRRIAPR